MENIFDKFKKLNLDTSPIGLSIELREPFFCTPIGAQIIGWDNGIHYCFIKGFKEIVFCVNPETYCNYYVYPLAKDFTDFLRLLSSVGPQRTRPVCFSRRLSWRLRRWSWWRWLRPVPSGPPPVLPWHSPV